MSALQERILALSAAGLPPRAIADRIGMRSSAYVYRVLDGDEWRDERTVKRRAKLDHPVREYRCSRCDGAGHAKTTCTAVIALEGEP